MEPESTPPRVDVTPRKKAHVWAHDKKTPAWQVAVAIASCAVDADALLAEEGFDAAVAHVLALRCG